MTTMKYRYISLLFVLMLMASECKKESPSGLKEPAQLNLPAKASEVITHSNGFGVDLFRTVAVTEDQNMMVSPLSASVALTMLLNGCKNVTYDQIQQMLGFGGQTLEEINDTYRSLVEQLLNIDPEVKLALANAVFYYSGKIGIHQSYLDAMENVFDAHIEGLDFTSPSALDVINGWAKDNTYGKIDKVIDQKDPYMVMFLMNALYFKGTWTDQFDKNQTAPGTFHLDDGSTTQVEMMHGEINAWTCSETDFSAIEMPYGRKNFSMIVIVPAGTLSEFVTEFDSVKYSHITAMLGQPEESQEYIVTMPKYTFKYEKQLNDQLKALGMTDAFDTYLADLTGIGGPDLYVDFVKQNTFVDVNEEGTEAAAVTTIGIGNTACPTEFKVDKPFIFAIRERTTNALLFIGKVEVPED